MKIVRKSILILKFLKLFIWDYENETWREFGSLLPSESRSFWTAPTSYEIHEKNSKLKRNFEHFFLLLFWSSKMIETARNSGDFLRHIFRLFDTGLRVCSYRWFSFIRACFIFIFSSSLLLVCLLTARLNLAPCEI